MASTEQTLTDGSPDGAIHALTVDAPIIEVFGMKHGDQVTLLHSMDGSDPADNEVAYVFGRNEKKAFPDFKSGDRIQAKGNWSDSGTRNVKFQVRS